MAAVKRCGRQVVCTSGNRICINEIGTDKLQIIQVKDAPKEDQTKGTEKRDTEIRANRVLASAFSASGRYFAVCDDEKRVHLYGAQWEVLSVRDVARRCTAVAFTRDENCLVVADKSGDVYQFSVTDPELPGTLILGHLSMLLDVLLTCDDEFVVTCDRDEKVRISSYPNAYNVHGYCLGHAEFVCRLQFDTKHKVLISGSGDGTVRLWNLDGQQLHCIQCFLGNTSDGDKIVESPIIQCMSYDEDLNHLAVTCVGLKFVIVYRLNFDSNCASSDLIGQVKTMATPWDICFDENHFLWILQPTEGKTLAVVRYQPEHSSKLVTVEDASVQVTVDAINNDWSFFQDSLDVEITVHTTCTRKSRPDNMTKYLERKQKRLDGQKIGPVDGGEPDLNTEPEDKRLKIS